MKKYDVVSICNALVDILVQVNDDDIKKLELTKGVMHLVDPARQKTILDHFREKEHTQELGGSAMNAIRTLASLGARTVFAGMVGQDEFGRKIQQRMKDVGIVAKLVEATEQTGTCAILVTPDGERTMNTALGASRLFDESLVPEQEIADALVFHFSGYQWDLEGQMRAIRHAIKTARANKTKVSFDVADPFVVKRHRDEFIAMINEGCDLVFANEEESKLLFNATPEAAAHAIAKTGATAVIKLGAKGALVVSPKGEVAIGPEKTTVVDTTAAGDMFAAGFLYGFYRNKPIEVCGKMASILAADVISRLGATVSDEALDKAAQL